MQWPPWIYRANSLSRQALCDKETMLNVWPARFSFVRNCDRRAGQNFMRVAVAIGFVLVWIVAAWGSVMLAIDSLK
jgi:hypothetical protein